MNKIAFSEIFQNAASKIFDHIFSHEDYWKYEFYDAEIAKELRLTPKTVSNILDHFENIRLIEVKRYIGRVKLYKIVDYTIISDIRKVINGLDDIRKHNLGIKDVTSK